MVVHISLIVSEQDLSEVKKLVDEGHALNVSDFIRSAIRAAISEKGEGPVARDPKKVKK